VNKNEVARSELVGADCVCILLLELVDGCEAGLDDAVSDSVKVFWPFL
jgi:hypothetical protein